VKAPIPRKQGLKREIGIIDYTIARVKAPIPRKQGLKPLFIWPLIYSIMSESAHSKKTRIETWSSVRRSCLRIRFVKAPIPRKQGLKLVSNALWAFSPTCVKAPIPRKQGLKLNFCAKSSFSNMWKRPFQENKDWNKSAIDRLPAPCHVKAPIPRKQGLKHNQCLRIGPVADGWKRPFQENKDWNLSSLVFSANLKICESAHSKKTRIETRGIIIPSNHAHFVKAPIPRKQGLKHFCEEIMNLILAEWKRPFQENKDWNFGIDALTWPTDNLSESAHSKKTRIETLLLIAIYFRATQVKAPIPRKQGLKPHWSDDVVEDSSCESAHSKKTRIETAHFFYQQ